MKTAIEAVQDLGLAIVKTHSEAGEDAAKACREWKLAERQAEEHAAMGQVLPMVADICRHLESVVREPSTGEMVEAAGAIEHHLPALEGAFLKARHAALDLLLWTRRQGRLEKSDLPDRYRSSYAALSGYTPIFKPWLEGLQLELVEMTREERYGVEAADLLSALTRFNAFLDSARNFVKAVVDPPLELVFHETNLLAADREELAVELRAHLASMLNDLCECLLYDEEKFWSEVEELKVGLPGGLESSLLRFPVGSHHVLFTVDQDPLFGELTVTLYRVVQESELEGAISQIFEHLHHKLGSLADQP